MSSRATVEGFLIEVGATEAKHMTNTWFYRGRVIEVVNDSGNWYLDVSHDCDGNGYEDNLNNDDQDWGDHPQLPYLGPYYGEEDDEEE